MTSPAYLAEVPEGEATGAVAEVYEDIRRVLRMPLVNLVYRHLAIEPERLEAAWRQLRPNLTDEAVDAGAETLLERASLGVPSLPAAAVRAAGLEPARLAAVAGTLDAYNHANPRNLIALLALLEGAAGTGKPRPAERRIGPPSELVPMAALDGLEEPVRALLDEMAGAVAARGEERLVPGLFRHLAQEPALLALAWTALRPAVEGRAVARTANAVGRAAAQLAAALPHPVDPTRDPATQTVLRRFAITIPRMIVVGAALRRALDEALDGGAL